jgi:hypothetical protein
MEWLKQISTHLPVEPIQVVWGVIAMCGGVARYLNSYTTGRPFKTSVLAASTFVSGFSGYMFATLGASLALPQSILFIMAGAGGFFGDQTMKYVMEYLQNKTM